MITTYEYQWLAVDIFNSDNLLTALNQRGAEGWRVADVLKDSNGEPTMYLLERAEPGKITVNIDKMEVEVTVEGEFEDAAAAIRHAINGLDWTR